MRRVHLWSGIATVLAFLGSGFYLKFAAGLSGLQPDLELIFISRHIYMLGPALVHLVLGVYVRVIPGRRVARLQWSGTMMLVLASTLMILAFVLEPVLGWERTPVSALGIFSLWAGTILHVIAPSLPRID